MDNKSEYTFRTKVGTCTLTRENLTLTRERGRGNIIFGKTVYRNFLINGIISAAALGLGIWLFTGKHYFSGVSLLIVGAYFIWSLYLTRNNSGINYIERAAVTSVETRVPLPPVNRGYFIVNFTHQGRARYRVIMMPDAKDGGAEEYTKALAALRDTGWLPPVEEDAAGETAD